MSYEVTATRRRPQKFDDLVGQEFVAETLKNSIKSGKIAHSYLFSGPRGCGKTSTARILAKALNCANGPTDCPCGVCANCQEITKGSSLDVIEIDGASNNGVEVARQIKDEVLFPPSNSRYKIYIIDEVHMLSISAFNALLKTIEEPPAYAVFIFATTELQKVPATIKSRCQQYNFRLVAIDKVKQCLADAAAELNIQADDEALFWIARESTGSMRDAYTLFDQVVAFSDGHITYNKIRDKLGLVGVDRLNTIFEACVQNQPETVVGLLDEFLQAGISIEQLISNCADYFRSLLLIKSGVTKESLLGNSVERYSSTVLNAWNNTQIERALSIYLQLYRDIRYSLSPRYELELSFSRLCWLTQYVSNAEVKKAIDAAQSILAGAPAGSMSGAKPAVMVQGANGAHGVPVAQGTSSAGLGTPGAGLGTPGAVPGTPGAVPGTPGAGLGTPGAVPGTPGVGLGTPSAVLGTPSAAPGTPNGAPVPEPEHQLPPGMPRFSSSMMAEVEKGEGNGDTPAEGDESHPFSNGGSLPPEQSVNEENSEKTQSAPVLDDRLKINIPSLTENPDTGVLEPPPFVPASSTGYTLNPDDEDDGWSNVDDPPEETYIPDDTSYMNYEDEPAAQEQNVSSAPVQLSDTFTTGDGRKISIAQLRGSVKAALEVNDHFASTSLDKTGFWRISDSTVETTVANNYDLEVLKKKIPVISQEISSVCGKTMEFKVSQGQTSNTQQTSVKKSVPMQVQILVDAFKGDIITGQ